MISDNDYEILKVKINQVLGIDLGYYKPQQMQRRLSGYLTRLHLDTRGFCGLIGRDPEATNELREFITINVSEFFRDPAQFDVLKKVGLPEILNSLGPVKVWSAGCSHGGEPYSVAMLLNELAPGRNHQVQATDIDRQILRRAQAGGPYAEADVRAMSKHLLIKYFDKKGTEFWAKDELRQMVKFKELNLLSDRFSLGLDLIICRNVVIYFSDEAKHTLNQRFYNSLKPGGFLFVGGTEALLGAEDIGFNRVRSSLYQRVEPASKLREAA